MPKSNQLDLRLKALGTLSVLIAEFKSQYGVALSNPLNYSQKVNKPVLYLIYAPWSNTFQVFNRDAINDPLIYEYMNLFEIIKIRGDMDEYKKLIPKDIGLGSIQP